MTSRRVEAFLPLTTPMLHTLVALADGDKHGYAIIKEIARRTEDAVRLSAGTLYALIRRAEADGLIVETDERPDISTMNGGGIPADAARPESGGGGDRAARGDRRDGAGKEARAPPEVAVTTRRPASWTDRIFRAVLRVFPFDFRADHGRDMEQTLRAQHREARRDGSVGACRLWLDVARDVSHGSARTRGHPEAGRRYALLVSSRASSWRRLCSRWPSDERHDWHGRRAHAVMLRPLAVDHPEQLISISHQDGFNYYVSYRDFLDYRAEDSVLSDAIGSVPRAASLSVDGGSERITLELVTDNYFSMLGVQPAAGRLIQPNEGRAPGDAPVLVLSYAYWQSRFGGDPSIIGRTIRLGRQPFTIIGVSSSAFRGTESLLRVRHMCRRGWLMPS